MASRHSLNILFHAEDLLIQPSLNHLTNTVMEVGGGGGKGERVPLLSGPQKLLNEGTVFFFL